MFFTYYVTGHKDYSVFHELGDRDCLIEVRVLSYRSSEFEFKSNRLANSVVTCCKYHPEKRGS